MGRVPYLEVEPHGGHPVGTTGRRDGRQHVYVVVGQHPGDIPQQSRPIQCLKHHRDHKVSGSLTIPVHVNKSVILLGHKRHGVRTVRPMHADATPLGHEPHNLVGWYRGAATGQPHQHVVQPLDMDPYPTGVLAGSTGLDWDNGNSVYTVRLQKASHPSDQRPGGHVMLTYRRVQRVGFVIVHGGSHLSQLRTLEYLAYGQSGSTKFTGEFLVASVDGLGSSLLGIPVLDLAGRPVGDHELQPVPTRARSGLTGSHHLNGVTGDKARLQRNQASAHLCAHACVPDVGVDGVGEVHHRGP